MQKYRFSFTGASLMVKEFVELARLLVDSAFDYTKVSSNNLSKDRETTRKREYAELELRLQQLSEKEIEFLIDTTLENQKLISFLACVRLYRILREFIEEVVWDRLFVFDHQLHAKDLQGFIYNKSMLYPEIEQLSENTQKKVQQVLFKMHEQAGLIDDVRSKRIQIPYLGYTLQGLLSNNDKKYLLNL